MQMRERNRLQKRLIYHFAKIVHKTFQLHCMMILLKCDLSGHGYNGFSCFVEITCTTVILLNYSSLSFTNNILLGRNEITFHNKVKT